MSRKLASIRTIADVLPIEGADAIECVVVDGWKIVSKKGEFSPGDLCVYFEIDSVLPIREEFEFLRRSSYVKKDWLISEANPSGEGFRLKTIKLRKQISQGLVVPLYQNGIIDKFATYENVCNRPYPVWVENITEKGNYITPDGRHGPNMFDLDLSNSLNIVKWDPPVPATLSGKARGNFPSFIPKTDEERIQNIKQRELDKYHGKQFEVTVKLDGSSMTVYSYQGKTGVCSRNLELDPVNSPDTTFAKVYMETGLDKLMQALAEGFDGKQYNLAIQGELMGPGIQGNRENLKEHKFFVFNVYDIDEGKYYTPEERHILVQTIQEGQKAQGYSLIEHCPVLDSQYVLNGATVDDYLEMAEGPSLNNPVREGLVFKCIDDPAFSFKSISNKFLMKEN